MLRSAIILLVLGGCLVALACGRPEDHRRSMQDVRVEQAPDQESWDVLMRVSHVPGPNDDSRPRLELEAVYMASYERSDTTYMLLTGHPDSAASRVTARIFDETGALSATLRAERVYYYEDEKRFVAQGDVDVETPDARRLQSEHLTWDEEERKIRTPGFVQITTPDERVQGTGLVADEDLETYQIGRISAEVTLEDDV